MLSPISVMQLLMYIMRRYITFFSKEAREVRVGFHLQRNEGAPAL